LFIQSDHPAIKNLVAKWTGGQPSRYRPAVLAKVLAARAIEHFQVSEQRFVFGRISEVAGLNVHGAVHAARHGDGSVFDYAAFLTALYRAAGLPARVVIGYDMEASMGSRLGIRDHHEDCERDIGLRHFPLPILRAWVEFYLLDEAAGRAEWIPVDIEQQRRVSSEPRPIDQPWKFFGNNECLDNVAPISFHFHPPTTVVNAGPPAMWGWLAAPRLPRIEQRLDFGATEPPKGSGADD